MNNETKDRSLPGPIRGGRGNTPGEYVIRPYVNSDWNHMLEQATDKTSRVVVPSAIMTLAFWLIIRFLPSNVSDYLMEHQDAPAIRLGSFLIISVTLALFVFVGVYMVLMVLYFWTDYRSKDLPFLVKDSLSYKTGVFSPRRYWITKDDIAEAVDGEVEFLTGSSPRFAGDEDYPAQRQVKWVSSEDQEERTGLATMTRPDVVILTDEHNQHINPDMIACHKDDEDDEEESRNRKPFKPENLETFKQKSVHESDQDETGGSTA